MRSTVFRLLLFAVAGLVLLGGCERPFTEPAGPQIEVVEPDLSAVLLSPNVRLRVRTTSFQNVSSVTVNGLPMSFNAQNRLWEDTLSLRFGLNTLRLEASDANGAVSTDTAQAVYLPYGVTRAAASLPEPRGGHATTFMNSGGLLVTGGAASAGASARRDAFYLPPGGSRFETIPALLNAARTGHTASLLPDGRVLILGGSANGLVSGIPDLVDTVELYDPEAQTFRILPFEGQPIRRAYHTASVHIDPTGNGVLIDLYGGEGDVRYTPSPRLGARGDLRRFRLVGETLTDLSPSPIGVFPTDDPLAGHSQTPLDTAFPGQSKRFLVAGSLFSGGQATSVSTRLFIDPGQGLAAEPAAPLPAPRGRHAAALLAPGYVLLFGGAAGAQGGAETLDTTLLYVEEADRYFRFPDVPPLLKRYGHTATNWGIERILLVGGFSQNGNALTTAEFFNAQNAMTAVH